MGKPPGWVAAVALAAVAGALVLANIALLLVNQSAAAAVAARREVIAQTPQLARVVQASATVLAQTAIRTDDPALRKLLASNGITVNGPAAATPTAPAAEKPAAPAAKP